jgi:hypothetical protein
MRAVFLISCLTASAACAKHASTSSLPDGGSGRVDGSIDVRPAMDDSHPSIPDVASSDVGFVDVDGGWTFPQAGGATWHDSVDPFCYKSDEYASDLWSDGAGVYVVTGNSYNTSLFTNAGSGWARVITGPPESSHLTGVPGGPLLFYGDRNCGVSAFAAGSYSCLSAVSPVSNLFVVDAERAFAIAGNHLMARSGSYFADYGSIPVVSSAWVYQLWADAQVVVVVALNAGYVYLFDGAASTPELLSLPDGMKASSLWGFARDDLWVGGEGGELGHYDGDSWTVVQATQGTCASIDKMWGADHVLYFATFSHVGRWRDGRIDTVLDGTCVNDAYQIVGTHHTIDVQKIWGNSPGELFILFSESTITRFDLGNGGSTYDSEPSGPCGDDRVYWFDGNSLGRL